MSHHEEEIVAESEEQGFDYTKFIDELSKSIGEISKCFSDVNISDLQYEGFNALSMAKDLAKIMTVRAKEGHESDLPRLIILGVERCNNIPRILLKSTEKGQKIIKELQQVYTLSPRGNTNKARTLSRIALCFPEYACNYMEAARNPVVSMSIAQDYIPSIVPYCLHQAFASIIPSDFDMRPIAILINIITSNIIGNETYKRLPSHEKVKLATAYVNAGCNSKLLSQKRRISICFRFKLLKRDNKKYGSQSVHFR